MPAINMKSSSKILVSYGEGTLAQADNFFAMFGENHIIGGSEIIVLAAPRIPDPD
ncbi:MAG: hypothetical protein WB799_03645 [Candidatus Sulfotelmatobacter sp.]